MNNNRNQNNNNRRRGRGNRQQNGGGNQGNRIDSRARGNAPQLLEKYKKLAEDAHRNGDRVQAEYYLQFADHYFRVIADNRSRQDEQRGGDRMDSRGPRRDDRERDDFENDEAAEFAGTNDFGSDDRRRFEPRERESREREGRESGPRDGRERDNRDRGNRDTRHERPRHEDAFEGSGAVEAVEGPGFEPEDNPFTRDARETREPREERPRRRAPRPPREKSDAGIDAAALPPAFSANDSAESAGPDEVAAPRRRRKRGEDGTLSAVG